MTTGDADAPSTRPQSLLERAVAVIEEVVDAGAPVGPRGLARAVGIDRSAVGRILQQMTDLGVFEKGPDGYVAGPRLFGIARLLAALDTLPAAAQTVLDDLVARYDETSYVALLHGESAVYLYESPSSNPLRFVVELGRPVPLHAGRRDGRSWPGYLPRRQRSSLAPGPSKP